MTSLATNLVESAQASPDRPAITCDDTTVTYAELLDLAGRVATMIRDQGVNAGDRVGLVIPNVPAFPVVFYGCMLAGATVVPMNPLLKSREVEFYLKDSGASLVFAYDAAAGEAKKAAETVGIPAIPVGMIGPDDLPEATSELVERDDSDAAVILYTSGTTGSPKGAELTHGNMRSNANTSVTAILELEQADVVMGCLPLFHVFGLTCGLNTAIAAGARLTLIPRFDAGKALEVIARDKVTVFEGVPTMYSAILHDDTVDGADVSTLRTCISGGAAMPVEVMKAFEEKLGCVVLEGYGLSETSPVASFNQPAQERKPGSIGTPLPGVEMKLVDDEGQDLRGDEVGEIAIRGENVMKGYWGKEEETREAIPDGWFRTGDLARRDSDGYYFIVDRKKDLIIRGGYNVYPREVEEVLYTHPAVAEAAVIGIPDAKLGEEIGAAVAFKPNASVEVDELRDFVKEQVAAYKYPRHVWVVDELPKGPTGKILRRKVEAPKDVEA